MRTFRITALAAVTFFSSFAIVGAGTRGGHHGGGAGHAGGGMISGPRLPAVAATPAPSAGSRHAHGAGGHHGGGYGGARTTYHYGDASVSSFSSAATPTQEYSALRAYRPVQINYEPYGYRREYSQRYWSYYWRSYFRSGYYGRYSCYRRPSMLGTNAKIIDTRDVDRSARPMRPRAVGTFKSVSHNKRPQQFVQLSAR